MICLPGSGKSAKALRLFRRVVVWDEAAEREIVLLTNNMKLAASTIAAVYKSRWQIELFFKALKQNLGLLLNGIDAAFSSTCAVQEIYFGQACSLRGKH